MVGIGNELIVLAVHDQHGTLIFLRSSVKSVSVWATTPS